ncbi:MAG TPA: dTDP-4-dehydrorhamnose 3,5-epimerase [Pirellulales bacterium]|nr:dTDP-4-dehydrorhamnose 3,5-epimerase [Pirellulales bacterium]
MKTISAKLPGVLLIEPRTFRDERGYFLETWHQERYQDLGLPTNMVQDNMSWSKRGVLRGLHLQYPAPQGKLVYVLSGQIFDVVADVRVGSPHFGRWIGFDLSLENGRQLYVPPGFAHGFCVVSATALVAYKCSDFYRPECEIGIAWNDPALAIDWPLALPTLSAKDARLPRLHDLATGSLPSYAEFADTSFGTRVHSHAA